MDGFAPLRRLAATVAPLSPAQERLWFIDQASPGSPTYNVPLLVRWQGAIDVEALRTALTAVAARHEVLRSTYQLRSGQPVQVVAATATVPLDVVEVTAADGWEQVRADAVRRGRESFDLAERPPVRCVAWRGVPGGDAVLLVIHHIAVDGWSLDPLFTDLDQAYRAAVQGREPDLPTLPVQYADYAAWDRELARSPEMRERLAQRAAELARVPRDLTLAGWRPAPDAAEGARPGTEHTFAVPDAVRSGVRRLARQLRVTPFVVFLCAFQVVLHRWSGREEFLVGALTANRPHGEVAGLVGFFVNTVPVRCVVEPELTFAELCRQARAEAFTALTHQGLPLDQLAAAARAGSPGPLVEVGFALQSLPPAALGSWPHWGPVQVLHTGRAKFDLMLVIEERPDGLTAAVESDTDRYPDDLGRRLADSWLALLGAVTCDSADPQRGANQLVCRLPISPRGHRGHPQNALVGEPRDLVTEFVATLQTAGTRSGPR